MVCVSLVYRFLFVVFFCCSTSAIACDNPLDAVAQEPLPASEESAHAAHFNVCFETFIAQIPADRRHQIPRWVDELLLHAARRGDQVVVRKMLDERANLGSPEGNFLDRTLSDVATQGYVEVTRLLLHAGADPNDPAAPVSPLYTAISQAHASTAQLLFAAGGQIRRHPSAPKETTLIEEALFASGEVAETIALLIEWGHDPSEPASDGDLPIHTAAALGRGDVIRVLVDGGAYIEALDQQGHTPLEVAARTTRGISALPALLELKATAVDAAFYRANLSGHDMNAAYLEAIGDKVAQQRILDQALIIFLQSGHGREIDDLLRAGANPNAFQGQEHPLQMAHCFPPTGNILLNFGADPDLAWGAGEIPAWAEECAAHSNSAQRYIKRLGFLP